MKIEETGMLILDAEIQERSNWGAMNPDDFLRVQSLTPDLSPKGREEARDSLPSLAGEGHGMGDGVLCGSRLGVAVNNALPEFCTRLLRNQQ